MLHYWKNPDDGMTYGATPEGLNRPQDRSIWNDYQDKVMSAEILRLNERVKELEGGEATNHYLIESLRKIREALQVAGLWTKRENGQGGTGDCAVAAIARIATLEAALVKAGEERENLEVRLSGRIAELETANATLLEDVQRVGDSFAERVGDSFAERIAELEEERDRLWNDLHGANVANELIAEENKKLAAENDRLRLSDARLTSLRLEVEVLKLDNAKKDRAIAALEQNRREWLEWAGKRDREEASLRIDLREAIRTGEELESTLRGYRAISGRMIDIAYEEATKNNPPITLYEKMTNRLARLDALLASEEVPEGLFKAVFASLGPSSAPGDAWRWFREQFGAHHMPPGEPA